MGFIRAFTGDMADIFEADGIAGASLDRIVDIVDIFKDTIQILLISIRLSLITYYFTRFYF